MPGRGKGGDLPSLDTSQAAVERVVKQACVDIEAGKSLLSIINRKIKDSGALSMASALEEHTSSFAEKLKHLHYELHGLQLRGNDISDAGVFRLGEALAKQGSLRKLDLTDNRLTAAGAEAIAKVAEAHPKLQVVLLGENNVGDQGAASLARAAAQHPELKELNLKANKISDAGAKRLAEALAKQCCPVEVLNLEGNRIGEVGAGEIADAIRGDSALKTLVLSGNEVGDTGAARLALMLHNAPGVKELQLESTRIGNAGAQLLAQALESHASLKVLGLARNGTISNAGARALLQALARQGRRDSTCTLYRRGQGENYKITCLSTQTAENLGAAARTGQIVANRGITLFWLLKFFKDHVGTGSIDAKAHSTETVVNKVIMTLTKDYGMSYSGGRVHSANPTVYVIHSWQSLFRDLVGAVAAYGTQSLHPPLDPDHLFYFDRLEAMEVCFWIDIFAIDQNLLPSKPVGHPFCETDKTALVLDQVKRRNGKVMLAADRDVAAMCRMWCMYEVFMADMFGLPLEVGFSRKPGPNVEAWKAGGVKQAEVSSKTDRELILKDVKDFCNGAVTKFDKKVREVTNALIKEKCEEGLSRLTDEQRHELDHIDFEERGHEGRLTEEEQVIWLAEQAAAAEAERLSRLAEEGVEEHEEPAHE